VLLGASAYAALDVVPPADNAFVEGMAAAGGRLADPPATDWDMPYRDRVDVMVLLASGTIDSLDQLEADVIARLQGFRLVGIEAGYQYRNDDGQTIEHFGYVDGISGPRFIRADVDFERSNNRHRQWDPAFPMAEVLIACAGGGYGSFAVFRKLEQNVRRFEAVERRIHGSAKISGEPYEPSAEVLIGRTIDGRPVNLAAQLPAEATENGFDHARQPGCPVGAHIRKANPRTGEARSSTIARRGIPYGTRSTPPHEPQPNEELPEVGVGLLFHAHMADIRGQFESMQQSLNHVDDDTPRDPVAGQGPAAAAQHGAWKDPRGGRETPDAEELGGHVTLRGGAYLFAPSLPFLRSLDR
jgi:Dyp-type peroxidase family